jgi:hypothetical protein
MMAIRAIFDGKAFVPQQPVSLPVEAEALVIIEQEDGLTKEQLDAEIRAYYEGGSDADDEQWAKATSQQSHRAWDED